MADIHIDDFYKDAATIFVRLYNSFPRKTILYVDDICGADNPDEFGLPSERFLAGFSAMLWLADQGYIQFAEPIRQEALDQAVLSEKAFVLLSSRSDFTFESDFVFEKAQDDHNDKHELPASVAEQSQTHINQLRKVLRSGSSTLIRQYVHQLLVGH